MKFVRTRNVKIPNRANKNDAGIDFYVPAFDQEMLRELENKNSDYLRTSIDSRAGVVSVHPGSRVLIPSGVKVIVPEGYALVGFNKSGVASKTGLILGACCIDEGYRAEIIINLINTSSDVVHIKAGMKIAQFVLLQMNYEQMEEIGFEEFDGVGDTDRGNGGFGSTGN